MTNFNPTYPSFLDFSNNYYSLDPSENTTYFDPLYSNLGICTSVLTFVTCFVGLWGNGIVIWLLICSIPRNPFTTFILNLAVADFGVLLLIPSIIILYFFQLRHVFYPYFYLEDLFMYMYTPGLFLLTAISVDRCVSVHFPIWHRCHRPKHFSAIVCAVTWVLSFLLCGIPSVFLFINANRYYHVMSYVSVPIFLFCLPLMTISAVSLFIKVCLKTKQQQRGNILTVILLTLLFFIIFAVPFNILFFVSYSSDLPPFPQSLFGFFFSSLNSSINPFIYFLIGRRKRKQSRESMKVLLQRVFSEEKDSNSQLDTIVQTQL